MSNLKDVSLQSAPDGATLARNTWRLATRINMLAHQLIDAPPRDVSKGVALIMLEGELLKRSGFQNADADAVARHIVDALHCAMKGDLQAARDALWRTRQQPLPAEFPQEDIYALLDSLSAILEAMQHTRSASMLSDARNNLAQPTCD